jgi:hypothetical protein
LQYLANFKINENGYLTFDKPYSNYIPDHFPLGADIPIVAAFWADIDIYFTGKGKIYFRVEVDKGPGCDSAKATVINHYSNGFVPKIAIVATWVNVTYTGGTEISPVHPLYCFSLKLSNKMMK